jgi:hypothetical protein
MTSWGKSESLCHKAREYYYDLLCHDEATVPEAIASHVEGCSFCREQIRRLEESLGQAQNERKSPEGPKNNQEIEALSRHFEFLDERIHCSHVKPFLPELLISSRQVRIPTPITVHVENCPACGEDLDSIRELGLRDDQLNRLSLFYGQVGHPSRRSQCRAARLVAIRLAAFSIDRADSHTLDHVCLCLKCRTRVYRERARAMAGRCVPDERTGVLACHEVSPADVFDFVVPFGLDADTIARTSGRRDAVATHLRVCPRCVEKVQSLHRTLYAVAERADSTVCTVCQTEKEDESRPPQTEAYRYPIHVQVLRQESARAAWSGFRPGLRNKIALAIAAVIVGGVLSIIPLSTATGGMNVGGVRKAVGRIHNVHITRSQSEGSVPYFEMWLAADRQTVVTKVDKEYTVHEFGKRLITVYTPGSPPRTMPQPAETSDSCRKFMTAVFRNMIFAHASETDSFSQAQYVASDRPGENWSMYELTQTGAGRGVASPRRQWKVFFDQILELPVKIEYSGQPSSGYGPVEVQVTKFMYLTRSAMDSEIKALLPIP